MNRLFKVTAIAGFVGALITGCSGGGGSDSSSAAVDDTNFLLSARGDIGSMGDVDWYEFTTTEDSQLFTVKVWSDTNRPDVEYLAVIYKEDEDGNKELVYGDHTTENTLSTPEVELRWKEDNAGTKYHISVRDLNDDEYDGFAYFVTVEPSTSVDSSSINDAVALVADQCQLEVIGVLEDVDVYEYTVAEASVVQFETRFNKRADSDVDLVVRLYDEGGNLVNQVSEGLDLDRLFVMKHYLQPGTYRVWIQDEGNNDYDSASSYEICATQSTAEFDNNDSAADANVPSDPSNIQGSLTRDDDEDWYQIPNSSGGSGSVNIIEASFSTADAPNGYEYEVRIQDADGNVLFYQKHNSSDGDFTTQLQVSGSGPYYMVVKPAGTSVATTNANDESETDAVYTATLDQYQVDDAPENGNGNNTQTTAQEFSITANAPLSKEAAKISYRGDIDWYKINVPNNAARYQVLSVYLEAASGFVDYEIEVSKDEREKYIIDRLGSDGNTLLKTSLLVPPGNDYYYIRVRDYQDNDADATSTYELTVDIAEVPISVAAYERAQFIHYIDEDQEQKDRNFVDRDERVVLNDVDNIIGGDNYDRQYAFDGTALAFDWASQTPVPDPDPDSNKKTITMTSDWIAGYIDYQGDQDYLRFELQGVQNIPVLDEDGMQETDDVTGELVFSAPGGWRYDAQVELISAGSNAEYYFKIHKAQGGNAPTVKYANNLWASAGDTTNSQVVVGATTTNYDAIDIVIGDDEAFWKNQDHAGVYFLKIGDNLIDTNSNNVYEENDWGYDEPYYVKLTLTYTYTHEAP